MWIFHIFLLLLYFILIQKTSGKYLVLFIFNSSLTLWSQSRSGWNFFSLIRIKSYLLLYYFEWLYTKLKRKRKRNSRIVKESSRDDSIIQT
jgi:hypothetical protein